jgi:hypothetical protein
MEKKQTQQMQIELSEAVAGGKYANLVLVAHSPSEFVLDFTQILPGLPKAKVVSRVILSPQHAKGLLQALQGNLQKYENEFGPIAIPKPVAQPPYQITPEEKDEKPN